MTRVRGATIQETTALLAALHQWLAPVGAIAPTQGYAFDVLQERSRLPLGRH